MAKMTPSCRNESTAFSSALAENGSFSFAPDGAGVGLRGRSCVYSFGGGRTPGGGREGRRGGLVEAAAAGAFHGREMVRRADQGDGGDEGEGDEAQDDGGGAPPPRRRAHGGARRVSLLFRFYHSVDSLWPKHDPAPVRPKLSLGCLFPGLQESSG